MIDKPNQKEVPMKISRSKLRSYVIVANGKVMGAFDKREPARQAKAALGGKAAGVTIQILEVTREVR